MNLSQRHQVVFDLKFPDGYAIKKVTMPNGTVIDEADFYHIMYIEIQEDGKRTRDVVCVQKYSVKDWEGTKRVLDKYGITVTGHDEYAIIHDPTAKVREAEAKPEKAEVKPETKAKGRPSRKQS